MGYGGGFSAEKATEGRKDKRTSHPKDPNFSCLGGCWVPCNDKVIELLGDLLLRFEAGEFTDLRIN